MSPPSQPSTSGSSINERSEPEADTETEEQKDERMKIYRALMGKRSELATQLNCMPYMVGSNTALMQIAEMKPVTLKELRECQRKSVLNNFIYLYLI